jgi:ABC-2 type transport system permease protein
MLAHSVSGIGVMMLMFGLVACASLLLRERESGTLVRLLLSPADHGAILWGKFLFTAGIGALQLTLLFTFGAFVFGVNPLQDPATFAVVTLSVLAAVTAFGMLIGTWAKTAKQAEGSSTMVILLMSALGGAWFPLQMLDLGTPMQIAMRCTLTHWAVSSYQGMFWSGLSWTSPEMLRKIAVLWGFAVVASVVARRLFQERYVDA